MKQEQQLRRERPVGIFSDMHTSGHYGKCPVCGGEGELKRAILLVNWQGGLRILFHGDDTVCFMPHQDEVLTTTDKGRWFTRPRDGRDEEAGDRLGDHWTECVSRNCPGCA